MADTSSDKLYQQLNVDELPPIEFITGNVALGTPIPDAGDTWNTRMTLQGIGSSTFSVKGYFGVQEILYTRISLSVLADVSLHSQAAFTLQSICDQLNASLGTFLEPADFEPVTIPTLASGASENVTLTAAAGSVGWLDSVTITLTNDKPFLNAVIGVRVLGELVSPTVNGVTPGYLITGAFDFTSLRDALVVNGEGTYTDFPALQNVCLALGIPGWTQGTITDQATSAVPNSDQSYDRVVVQATVSSAKMSGPLYFHYNNFDEA